MEILIFFLSLYPKMIQLPEDFVRETTLVMGEERFNSFMEAFNEEAPTSIRLNPKHHAALRAELIEQAVPWCPEGFYLKGRPSFTFDPLFHAGCYYVQEAASMFVCHILRTLLGQKSNSLSVLDMCAAPGGKSTAARSVLPEGSLLFSNEPIASRAQILLENITKWGWNDCVVIGEWSLQNVEKCWRLQREIVADAWECLTPGGILIYSTCTFNTKENEENVRWIIDTYDAEPLEIPTKPEWRITGSLLAGFEAPVYRFIPGITQSEGLFVAVLRKGGTKTGTGAKNNMQHLKVLKADLPEGGFPQADLSYSDALKYLRGESLTLSADTPRGFVTVTYKGFALGPVKNIGNRANNLYPKPWRIKTTHLPTEPVEMMEKVKR